jgi:hypothetical protein
MGKDIIMKYLTDYTEAATTKLLNDCGAFYAFGTKQFDEQKREGITYVSMGAGLICPKENADRIFDGVNGILAAGIAADLKENGKDGIIRRELANHEAYYTGDIGPTVAVLTAYGFTPDEIMAVYLRERSSQEA